LNAHLSGLIFLLVHLGSNLLIDGRTQLRLVRGCKHGAQPGAETVVFSRARGAGAVSVQEHTDGYGKTGMHQLAGHMGEAYRHARSRGDAKLALGYIQHTRKHGTSAGKNASGAEGFNHAPWRRLSLT